MLASLPESCNRVSCGLFRENVAVKLLLYADDIVIFSHNPADLQRALDAAHAWALSWRFHFGVGPKTSAVMVLGHGRGRTRAPAFSLGGQVLPRVKTYTYLGVSLRENLSWKGHIALQRFLTGEHFPLKLRRKPIPSE